MRGRFFLRAKKTFGVALAAAALVLNMTPQAQSIRALPDHMVLDEGRELNLDLFYPVRVDITRDASLSPVLSSGDERLADVARDLTTSFSLPPQDAGEMRLDIRLFGFIPVKSVNVTVYPERVLVPGGQAIGVTLKTRGVLVVGVSAVDGVTARSPAREAGLRPGDVIEAVDGVTVNDAVHLSQLVSKWSSGTLRFTIRRGESVLNIDVKPERDRNDSETRIGAWVRDSTAGVGTLSWYDPATHRFGALGHAITDPDTGNRLSVRNGEVFLSSIVDVRVGQKGDPGELKGMFPDSRDNFGSIQSNTEFGIYGVSERGAVNALYPQGLPAATQDQVREGKCSILTTVDNQGIKEYAAEIVQVNRQNSPSPRSLVVRITDPELLKITGGIVQGMSGSPILQDGRIVGAVTHVYVNDPTRGYGLFIEWMK